ncbi:hypothetical protein F4604DRAFT_1932269 [Suillus subluteus]|nr:hypothetical protein F4604DRAFT_1932269 [Suillus subluteus]
MSAILISVSVINLCNSSNNISVGKVQTLMRRRHWMLWKTVLSLVTRSMCVCTLRKALVALSDHVDYIGWERKLQPLKKSHLRPMGDFTGQSQGTAIMSWIWLTYGISDDDSEGLQDLLRVEWCKARARRDRWVEEMQLLLQEMQWILLFLNWQAHQWDEHTSA